MLVYAYTCTGELSNLVVVSDRKTPSLAFRLYRSLSRIVPVSFIGFTMLKANNKNNEEERGGGGEGAGAWDWVGHNLSRMLLRV